MMISSRPANDLAVDVKVEHAAFVSCANTQLYAEGRHETTYVNFSEDGQLDSWTDMVYIDASGQFILGIHADGSPDMIGSYRYNPWRASMQAA